MIRTLSNVLTLSNRQFHNSSGIRIFVRTLVIDLCICLLLFPPLPPLLTALFYRFFG